jgi:cytochrome c oxidase subunit II
MKLRRLRRLATPLFVFGALLLLSACAADAPQDALAPDGPISRQIDTLFRPVFWIATFVFVFVEGLIVFAVFKFRDHAGREEPKQIHGNSKLEFTWTLIPALILLGIAFPTVATIFSVSAKHTPDEVRVRVIGHQWWWEYQYADFKVNTANELVIPINKPVYLELESADVIHSFWVPKLAGKQDVVPERINTLMLEADNPGQNYFGQCAEFCSISHANMRLRVLTKTQAEFDEWIKQQQAKAAEPTDALARQGQQLFMSNACIQCHRIDGVEGATATTGPNLTHFAGRTTFGSATFQNTDELLFEWIKHAREAKPGVLMPNFDEPLPDGDPSGVASTFKQLDDDEVRALVAYLRSLV